MTSSPSPISNALNARTKASVPLLQLITSLTPISEAKESSNLAIS